MINRRLLNALLASAALSVTPAQAQSSINTGQPASNSNLSSLTLRQQFQAAASDINALTGMHGGTATPSPAYNGEDWLNTGTSPAIWYKYANTCGCWTPVGTINLSTGVFVATASPAGALTGTALPSAITSAPGLTVAQPDSGATVVTQISQMQTYISDIDYLPVGQPDGTTDNSTAIGTMGSLLCARKANFAGGFNNGGEFHFRALQYVIHDVGFTCGFTLKGVHNRGEGGGAPNGNLSGTKIIYTAATNWGIQFASASYPATQVYNAIQGVKVEDLYFYTGTTTTGVVALRLAGVYLAIVDEIGIGGIPYTGILAYGFNELDIDHANIVNVTGAAIYLIGDAAGKTNALANCTSIGTACSTFSNVANLHDITASGNGTSGIGVAVQGTVDTVSLDHIGFEGGQYGLEVDCPPGFASASWCPQFITGYDFEAEGASGAPLLLEDMTDFQCFGCYAVGNGTTNLNVVDAILTNYSQSGGAPGGFRWIGGRMGDAQHECGYFGVSDVIVKDTWGYGCDLVGGGTYAVFNAAAGAHHLYDGNTLGTIDGVAPPVADYPATITSATKVRFVNNMATGLLGTVTSGVLPLQAGSADVNANNDQ